MILSWLRRFEEAPNRCVVVRHVEAHKGDVGNERADVLVKMGSELRHKTMVEGEPVGWIEEVREKYWENCR